jgi:ribosomal protein L16 Arg81 hydroxylase
MFSLSWARAKSAGAYLTRNHNFQFFGQVPNVREEDLTIAIDEVLEEGDFLYVPPYTFHHVQAVTDNVMLSFGCDQAYVTNLLDFLTPYINEHYLGIVNQEVPYYTTGENWQKHADSIAHNIGFVLRTEEFRQAFKAYMQRYEVPKQVEILKN